MKRLFRAATFVIGLVALGNPGEAADTVIVESSFAKGLDGWTSNAPNEIRWAAKGGWRDGYLQAIDRTDGGIFGIAPAKFRGNYSRRKISAISFYHKVVAVRDVAEYVPYHVTLSGPGGSAEWFGRRPKGPSGWIKNRVPLVERNWTIKSGTWRGLLNNVTDLQIEIELATNRDRGDRDTEGIDHVQLLASAPEIASVQSIFAKGPEGWSSNAPNEFRWVARDGWRDGYLQGIDRTDGAIFAIAPAKFRGNYTRKGVSAISFYHKVIAVRDVVEFVPYHVTLSGPGGSAEWFGSKPKGPTGWVKNRVPLVQKEWTVRSGTWRGLLNNVTDLQIEIELATNRDRGDRDTEGIDHVQLLVRGR